METFLEPWIEIWHGLREQRARTVMTLLGLAWGTFAVVVLLAFGEGLRLLLSQRAAGVGHGIAVVWPRQTTKSFEGLGRNRFVRLEAPAVAALPRRIPELDLVSPEYIVSDRVDAGVRVHRATLAGVYPTYAELRAWQLEPGGRFLNDRDLAERRRVAVLGSGIKNALFGDAPAVGRTVVLRKVPFLVIGTMRPKEQDSDYDGRDENRVCLPATTHELVFGSRFLSDFVYRAHDPELHDRATTKIYQALGRTFKFDPEDRFALNIWDTNESDRMRAYVFLGLNLMLGGSGILTLLVGGVGVANLMFIRVRQRTHEIGIKMALGATPRRILLSVLTESLVLVAVGGALGFGLSWLTVTLTAMTPLTRQIGEPQISWIIAGSTVFLLGTVGLLAGYFPARRAARLDPVQTLAEARL